jgi:hypothetical protein
MSARVRRDLNYRFRAGVRGELQNDWRRGNDAERKRTPTG